MSQKTSKIIQSGIIIITTILNTSNSFANTLAPIPAVDQLKKTRPADPNYRDFLDLAQRYNCTTKLTQDYQQLMTRYELILGLNSCWQRLKNKLDFQERLIWHRLQQDFAQLQNHVDNSETDLTQLESAQFSTTTQLEGQVLFFVTDSLSAEDNSETFTGYRTRLDFNTSFSGQDLLKIRLESRDIGSLDDVTNTLLTRTSVDGSTEDQVEISELSYTFKPQAKTTMTLGTAGVGLNDVGEVLNPFSSSSKGAVSRFGRRNPATLRGSGGAGIGIKQQLSDRISASAGYLIDSENIVNSETGGLFNSSASAISQIVMHPQDDLSLAFTYTHTYQRGDDINLMGSTGLADANEPFGNNATTSDNFGLQGNWQVSSSFEIGGWFGYTSAQQQEDGRDSATILNGALTLAFPDLFADNNQGGIIIGVPPTISGHDDSSLIAESTPLHFEVLYRIELREQIQITPGAFAIVNPDDDDGNTIWVGTVRTLFSF